MTSVSPPLCWDCKHFKGYKNNDSEGEINVCDAFPDGIPDIIYGGDEYGDRFIHVKPYKGDKGIRFSPIKNMSEFAKMIIEDLK